MPGPTEAWQDRDGKVVHHQLNCAKLMPHPLSEVAHKCSCGAEKYPAVHNHGPAEGKGLECREYRTPEGYLRGACLDDAELEKAQAGYVGKMASPRLPEVPPVDSEDFGATLTRWWVGKAQEEASALVPKATEYGGAHRASDLTQLGRTIAELMGYTGTGDFTEGQLQELACYFYIQGKLGRWQAALLEGRQVSDDTVHDIKVYTTMVQRIREKGGWPV